jgi:hypothetical protein
MHWYDTTGNPVVEIPKKSGDGMRKPTIADARKNDYVPGTTGILDTLGKQGLTHWIINQHISAAWEVEKNGDYNVWESKVREKADEKRYEAANLGSSIHDAIETYLKNKSWPNGLNDYKTNICGWIDQNVKKVIEVEGHIKTIHGYGGRYDLICVDKDDHMSLIDFKTQGAEDGKPFRFYNSWGAQLAAYSKTFMSPMRLRSVAISTKNPNRQMEEKDWYYDESIKWFEAAFLWWKLENNWQKK